MTVGDTHFYTNISKISTEMEVALPLEMKLMEFNANFAYFHVSINPDLLCILARHVIGRSSNRELLSIWCDGWLPPPPPPLSKWNWVGTCQGSDGAVVLLLRTPSFCADQEIRTVFN